MERRGRSCSRLVDTEMKSIVPGEIVKPLAKRAHETLDHRAKLPFPL